MSNVLARNRQLTKLDFYNNAVTLRKEIVSFVMNEKNVPKKWRFVLVIPTIEVAENLVNDVTLANSYFPSSIKNCEKRKEQFVEAIADCEILYQKLQFIIDTVPVNINKLYPLGKMISQEIKLLKGCVDSTNSKAREFKKNMNSSNAKKKTKTTSDTKVKSSNPQSKERK